MHHRITRSFTLAVSLALGAPLAAVAQTSSVDQPVGGVQVSRDELQQRLAEYEETAGSSAYSSDFRAMARQEAELIRTRLEHGDFNVGDQIRSIVEGEEALTGTFVVTRDRTLELPAIGSIALEGVLRSELEDHLTEELERYIRDPRVQARGLFRVTVTGAVGTPGFYVVPAEAVLTEVLMTAGGPERNADLRGIRIERQGETIWEARDLRRPIIEGRTLDQLSLSAGDEIVVPSKKNYFRTGLAVVSAAASITYLLIRIF